MQGDTSTRKRMTFVNTTAIAYGQKIGRSLMILVVCNSSCVHKHHAFASRVVLVPYCYRTAYHISSILLQTVPHFIFHAVFYAKQKQMLGDWAGCGVCGVPTQRNSPRMLPNFSHSNSRWTLDAGKFIITSNEE